MNSFSNMEINDLLDNRFRLDPKHTPNYLAECFQRLFPTLGRMGLSTVIDEMARANHRAFNSSRLPVRGETLSLEFFFELWRRNFRFEGSHSDKFTFSDELKLAHTINQREFWEILIRADRDMGTYLKDAFELMQYRELPREISFTLKAGRGSLDYQEAAKIRELLPRTNGSLGKMEDIAKACISIWGMPKFFDERRLVEELCRENNIRRIDRPTSAIHGYAGTSASMPREPCVPYPLKNIANLRVDFLKRAAEDRFREDRKMEELSSKEFKMEEVELPTNSLPPLSQQELLLRGGEKTEKYLGSTLDISQSGVNFIKSHEGFSPYVYGDRDVANPKIKITLENISKIKGKPTIGYGYYLKNSTELNKYLKQEITEAEGDRLLREFLLPERVQQVQISTKSIYLTQNQFDAIVSYVYNRGIGTFLRSQIYTELKKGDYRAAAMGFTASLEFDSYDKATAPGLKTRRQKEQDLFLKGL